MEKATVNIKDPKIRAYFDDVTEGKSPAVTLTADEYEQGVEQFDNAMRKIIADADEMIFRAKLGDLPDALSLSYIAKRPKENVKSFSGRMVKQSRFLYGCPSVVSITVRA